MVRTIEIGREGGRERWRKREKTYGENRGRKQRETKEEREIEICMKGEWALSYCADNCADYLYEYCNFQYVTIMSLSVFPR